MAAQAGFPIEDLCVSDSDLVVGRTRGRLKWTGLDAHCDAPVCNLINTVIKVKHFRLNLSRTIFLVTIAAHRFHAAEPVLYGFVADASALSDRRSPGHRLREFAGDTRRRDDRLVTRRRVAAGVVWRGLVVFG